MPVQLQDKPKIDDYIFSTFNYTITTAEHQGKKHLIVPVVMMVEGVHSGSNGATYHSISELGKIPGSWNGIPVSIKHPEKDGINVSANSPDIIDSQTVGRVYNTYVEGSKLKAECWLDEEKLKETSSVVYEYILSQKPLDVSVGVFTDDEVVQGDWNGETYSSIARNHRPDHLALLPGGRGACSWEDGCGIRVNSEGGLVDIDLTRAIKQLALSGYSVVFQTDEKMYLELIDKIQTKLDRMDSDIASYYLTEVFDDYFVYRVRSRENNEISDKLLKRSYNITEQGIVNFGEDVQEVYQKTEYVTMQEEPIIRKRTKKGGNVIMDNVEKLIQSNMFAETDKEWLEALSEEAQEKLIGLIEKKKEEPVVNTETAPTKEEALKVLKETINSTDEFFKLLPENLKDQMQDGLKLHQEAKASLVKTITDYSDAYTQEELEAKGMDELRKLSKLVPVKRDFSVNGAGNDEPVMSVNELLLPCGVEIEESK